MTFNIIDSSGKIINIVPFASVELAVLWSEVLRDTNEKFGKEKETYTVVRSGK